MKKGNWIPIDKGLVGLLPKDRPYTDIEAYISLRVDMDNSKVGSIAGYAALWKWSRKKVRRFLELMEKNPDGTGKPQARNRKGTGKGQVIRLVFNNLQAEGPTKGTEQEHTYDTNPKPSKEEKGSVRPSELHHTLSFEKFKKLFLPENEDGVEAVELFLTKYRKNLGKEHHPLRPQTWQLLVDTIVSVKPEYSGSEGLTVEDLKIMIERYFETKFQPGCDYSIVHFNQEGVKTCRYYEVAYEAE